MPSFHPGKKKELPKKGDGKNRHDVQEIARAQKKIAKTLTKSPKNRRIPLTWSVGPSLILGGMPVTVRVPLSVELPLMVEATHVYVPVRKERRERES